jgi:hypothetical protein
MAAIASRKARLGRDWSSGSRSVASEATIGEALGRIVKREPQNQHGGEGDVVAGGGLADGQPIGEVLLPDSNSDQQRQAPGGRQLPGPPLAGTFSVAAIAPGPPPPRLLPIRAR